MKTKSPHILQIQGFTVPCGQVMDSGARKALRFLLSQGPVSLCILGLLSALKRSISSLEEYVRLSSLVSYNRIPYPAGLVNNRSVFLTVLEAGSLRPGCQQGPHSGENLF